MTTVSAWTFLIFSILANSSANILIKKASLAAPESQLNIYLNPYFLSGLVLFGVNLIFYAQALRKLPISIAYPILIGGSLFIIANISIFSLGESLSLKQLLGMIIVSLGVWLIL